MRRLCPLARGTTSACAENTGSLQGFTCYTWNYLRVRGEYWRFCNHTRGGAELPPRARRIHVRVRIRVDNEGTTSACAENTTQPVNHEPPRWNYLRVRGEYRPKRFGRGRALELPPRARRIRGFPGKVYAHGGTTSACAENTSPWIHPGIQSWNYLRVRGEYSS